MTHGAEKHNYSNCNECKIDAFLDMRPGEINFRLKDKYFKKCDGFFVVHILTNTVFLHVIFHSALRVIMQDAWR
jgi:hypothetical protein